MQASAGDGVLQGFVDDIRAFFRSPGLVAITSAAVLLVMLFIVYPIATVLEKSFTVAYPTVTARY